MNERKKLIKKLTRKGFCFSLQGVENLADWIIKDRKRILKPLISYKNGVSKEWGQFHADRIIEKTLSEAGAK